ncbi:hypothetical protein [Cytobacillus praedii]|uniref:hypothetical protein n=1 Tax=Cytobacillus praedii TaxID=1742358 RepID=UPI002E21928F|nr:hypothetical protein [Cytobacillus praedii]
MKRLKEIVEQLKSCGFSCEAGPLENNIAFIELQELAENPSGDSTVFKHKDYNRLTGKKVTVDNQPFIIAAVALDGTLFLEPADLYGTEDSLGYGNK